MPFSMPQATLKAYHFIAIGGTIPHSLAVALHQQGHHITGSDDALDEPARSALARQGLLPAEVGWFPDRVHPRLDAVILGMHAQLDNPELERARALGIRVYSYPEFLFTQSRQKQRVVIAGSHGKTTITLMVLHVLNYHHRQFDYVVGASSAGIEALVRLSDDSSAQAAPVIILEGDEYASSPIDPRPKFLHYQPHMALISGLAWDHANLYPTYEQYVDQFELLADQMPKSGVLIFNETDNMLDVVGEKDRSDVQKVPYKTHPHLIRDGQTYLTLPTGDEVPVRLFGRHNMKNIAGALALCDRLGITDEQFYEAISSFDGPAGHLERIAQSSRQVLYRDMGAAPSQVKAATEAVKAQHPDQPLLACLELSATALVHPEFLAEYQHSLAPADLAAVYVDQQAGAAEEAAPVDALLTAFAKPGLQVFTQRADLDDFIRRNRANAAIFLMLGAGTFGGLDLPVVTGIGQPS